MVKMMSEKQEKIFTEIDKNKVNNMLNLFDRIELSEKQQEELLRRMSTIRYNTVTGNSGTAVRNFGLFKGSKFLEVENCEEIQFIALKITGCGGYAEESSLETVISHKPEQIDLELLKSNMEQISEYLPKINSIQLIPVRLVVTKLALQFNTTYSDILLNYHLDIINELPKFQYYFNQLRTK